jgi:hypothetical protein
MSLPYSFYKLSQQDLRPMQNITETFDFQRLKKETTLNFKVNTSTPWIFNLYKELSEGSELSEEEIKAQGHLNIDFDLYRFNDSSFADSLIVDIIFDAVYPTKCIQTLVAMSEQLQFKVSLVFIHESFLKSEEFQDQTDAFIRDELRELYFFDKGKVMLFDALREQTFLHFNYYPKIS